MCQPAAPTPPDPKDTSAAQTGTNVATAVANQTLGNVDQYGPTGSLTYENLGNESFTDPYTGKSYDIPRYSATTALTPEEQAIFDSSQGARGNLAQTADQQSGFLRDYLGTPGEFDTSAIEARIGELGAARLDPQFERERAATETRLANQGLTQGSAAWEAEMSQFNQGKNDAYNNLALQGRGQALSEMIGIRNQPINEIAALLSGSQVQTPNFAMAQQPRLPTTDVAGLIGQEYNQKYGNYQNQVANRNQIMGGLFGLGAAKIGTM
jgi:hypothetical protein